MTVVLQRLRQRAEFLRVAGFRRKWAAPGLVLQAVPSVAGEAQGEGVVKVGFTVTRKVGNAVKRNRARRRLRAAAAEVLPAEACSGFDLVLIGRSETLDRPFRELVGDLRGALRRLGALCPHGRLGALCSHGNEAGGDGERGRGERAR
ncbi:MAG: ribonuclease P protein component [Alphaproteobacteria bacterium]|nr:ribonuclease P protein component [Alphaproteobacteria bacterium]MBF0129347.1 ribonuclease P protein component [Alphaproteobacteria bacterium]